MGWCPMPDINKPYLQLLRDQVEVEIKYLVSVGHDTQYPTDVCVFCTEYKGRNICNRLRELREFLSQIVVNMNQKNMKTTPKDEFLSSALDPSEFVPLLPSVPIFKENL